MTATMRKVTFQEAQYMATRARLWPCILLTDYDHGKGVLRFAKGDTVNRDERFMILPWSDFEREARLRGVAVYESKGWLKIMKDV